jgi:hypothetical protein
MNVPKPNKAAKIVIAGIMLLVLASAGVLAACQNEAPLQTEAQADDGCELPEGGVVMDSSGKVSAEVTVPPIDLAAPGQVEIATFALG